jgi:hypothetical protein
MFAYYALTVTFWSEDSKVKAKRLWVAERRDRIVNKEKLARSCCLDCGLQVTSTTDLV